MRTLNKNKQKLWAVNIISVTEAVDENGNLTGEMVETYAEPVPIFITLYPSNGNIVRQIFGQDASYDMIAVSETVELLPSTLLFRSQPVNNYATTYDYRVEKIQRSLNVTQYGLESRT